MPKLFTPRTALWIGNAQNECAVDMQVTQVSACHVHALGRKLFYFPVPVRHAHYIENTM